MQSLSAGPLSLRDNAPLGQKHFSNDTVKKSKALSQKGYFVISHDVSSSCLHLFEFPAFMTSTFLRLFSNYQQIQNSPSVAHYRLVDNVGDRYVGRAGQNCFCTVLAIQSMMTGPLRRGCALYGLAVMVGSPSSASSNSF